MMDLNELDNPHGLDLGFLTERYPNTKGWTSEMREMYLTFYADRVRALVNGCPRSTDPAISRDDLFQDAQVACYKSFDRYDPSHETMFSTYSYQSMKNAIFKNLRAQFAGKRLPTGTVIPYEGGEDDYGDDILAGDNMEVPENAANPDTVNAEETFFRKEILVEIQKLLNTKFSDMERIIFNELSNQTSTQVQLAKRLHCSQGKVSMMYKFIRIKLQFELRRLGYIE